MTSVNDIIAHFKIEVDESGSKKIKESLKTISDGLRAVEREARAKLAIQRLDVAEAKERERQEKEAYKTKERERRENERKEKESLRRRRAQYEEFTRTIKKMALGLIAMTAMVKPTTDKSLDYRDFARQTGMSIEDLQQYQAAAFQTGSRMSNREVMQEIAGLQQRLVNIEFGQGDLFPFKMLGISGATRDAMAVIEALRDSIQSLPDPEALNLIQRLGLSADWLHILRQSRAEFERLKNTMLSREQIKATTALALSIRRIGFAISNLRDQIVAFVSRTASHFIDNLRSMIDDVSSFLKVLYESPNAIRVFALALTGLGLLFAPLKTALVGLYLLLEDFYVYTKGGVSLFDWGKIPDMTALVEGLKIAGKLLYDTFKLFYHVGEAIGEFVAFIVNKISELTKTVKAFLDWWNEKFGKKEEPATLPVNRKADLASGVFGEDINAEELTKEERLDLARRWLQRLGVDTKLAEKTPLPTGNVTNQYAPTNNITVNVRTPEEGSRFTNDYVNRQNTMNTTFVDMAAVGGY